MRKFKIWCDSGANICSEYSVELALDDILHCPEDWDNMTEEEQEEIMKEIAFERLDWGYCEIE